MRLLADENIQAPLVGALRERGYDILYIGEFSRGVTDQEVLETAVSQERIILTEDKDFGDLVFRVNRDLPGIILLRLQDVAWQSRFQRLDRLFQERGERLRRLYVVVEPSRIRLRSLP